MMGESISATHAKSFAYSSITARLGRLPFQDARHPGAELRLEQRQVTPCIFGVLVEGVSGREGDPPVARERDVQARSRRGACIALRTRCDERFVRPRLGIDEQFENVYQPIPWIA